MNFPFNILLVEFYHSPPSCGDSPLLIWLFLLYLLICFLFSFSFLLAFRLSFPTVFLSYIPKRRKKIVQTFSLLKLISNAASHFQGVMSEINSGIYISKLTEIYINTFTLKERTFWRFLNTFPAWFCFVTEWLWVICWHFVRIKRSGLLFLIWFPWVLMVSL